MRRMAAGLAVLGLGSLPFAAPLVHATRAARSTPTRNCAVAKLKACGKGIAGEMGCYAKAQARSGAVDPNCLAGAQSKADAAINRAGSACAGSQGQLDPAITQCVDQLHTDTSGAGKCPALSAKAAGNAVRAELDCRATAVTKAPSFAACDLKEDARTKTALGRAGGCADTTAIIADTENCSDAIANLIAPPTTTTTLPSGQPSVFLIIMENRNWSSIKGNASAPYINNTLLPMGSHAEQYYNPPGVHPSEPNYLWLEAGTNFGIFDDNPPALNHQATASHLVSLLDAAGITWKTYQEDTSGTHCPLSDRGSYAVRHDPFVFFDDVTQSNDPNGAYCVAHVRPYSELQTDIGNNVVARYNFITPNVCNDMHDSCAPLNNRVKQGDTWLSTEVPKLLASQAYANNGVLFITWDEANTADGPIGMIVLSPLAKGGGYANTIHYTHGSMLRTVQEIFGVTPLLNDAANATDLADLFLTLP